MSKNLMLIVALTIAVLGIIILVANAETAQPELREINLEKNPGTIYVGSGPGNDSITIQGGINLASAGDTVFVWSGSYYEKVVIDKTISLVGEDRATTIIDGGGTGDVIYISAGLVNVSGVGVRNGNYGIYLYYSSNNQITNCSVYNNFNGVELYSSSNNKITNCSVYNNARHGIWLSYSSNNFLRNNVLENNKYNFYVYGWAISHYYQDINTSNTVNGKPIYYIIERSGVVFNNTSTTGYLGLVSCTDIRVENLTLADNGQGLLLANTFYSTITNCSVYNNAYGIDLYYSSNNQITNSALYNNSDRGIYLAYSSNSNSIYHNNFIDNAINAYDECSNFWNTTEGNYWDDYIGSDTDSNWIGDSPYSIFGNGNQDNHPLMHPYPVGNPNKPKGYSSIQAAIDDANVSDSIYVWNGTYYENIIINKSISLVGRDKNNTIIDSNGRSNVINIFADLVNVSGFGVKNGIRGIYLSSSDNKITNCTIYNNAWYGIHFYSSSSNWLTNCAVYNNAWHGIWLYSSSNNQLTNSSVYNNAWCGIWLSYSSNNWLTNCSVYNNSWDGIELYYSLNNQLTNCALYNNSYVGIELSNSSSNQLTNCALYNNSYDGIKLYYSLNNQITNCNVYNNNWYGIWLSHSQNNQITNSSVYNNSYDGIELHSSSNNQLTRCSIYNNSYYGIEMSHSSDNQLTNCSIYNNSYDGIELSHSSNNHITNCTLYKNSYDGIELSYSSNNHITNCTLYKNSYDGIELSYSSNNQIINCGVHNNNLVGVYLRYSSNNQITNCDVYDNNWYGIWLYYSPNNQITNCNVYNDSQIGIYLYYSSNNTMANCTIYNDNQVGISLYSSSNNRVTNSALYNNSYDGIELGYSSNNKITNCSVYNNDWYGIRLYSSPNNEAHYCNIYNNTRHGIYNHNTESTYVVNATYCWWGDGGGPYHPDTNPNATGDNVTDNVLYDPWLIEPLADFTSPTIESTSPANSEIDVLINTTIVITFSESMNASTIPGNIMIEPTIQIQNYTWSNENKTLTLVLASNLSSYTQYTITINTNIEDAATVTDSSGLVHSVGNRLREAYQFSFRAKDVTPPIITIISPANGTITNQNVTLIYIISDNADTLEQLNITANITAPVNVTSPANNTIYSLEGSYIITITVKDRANNSANVTILFIIDKTSPQLDILSPANNTITDQNVILRYSVSDNIDTPEEILVNIENGTVYSEEGRYTVTIYATDRAGNTNQTTVSFRIEKIPPLPVEKPAFIPDSRTIFAIIIIIIIVIIISLSAYFWKKSRS